MIPPPVRFDNVRSVEFAEKRWTVGINVTLADGTVLEFIASADSGDTDNNHIWFGTRDDYEAIER